jgi:hypothetical protein
VLWLRLPCARSTYAIACNTILFPASDTVGVDDRICSLSQDLMTSPLDGLLLHVLTRHVPIAWVLVLLSLCRGSQGAYDEKRPISYSNVRINRTVSPFWVNAQQCLLFNYKNIALTKLDGIIG